MSSLAASVLSLGMPACTYAVVFVFGGGLCSFGICDICVIVSDLGVYFCGCVVFGGSLWVLGSCDMFYEGFGVYDGDCGVSGADVAGFCGCMIMDGGLFI